jgi:hypothetical protein
MLLATAPVWHEWIAVLLFIFAVIPAIIACVAFFLTKTQSPKYERVKE